MQAEIITMEEAVARGYTHFVEEEGEQAVKFSSIEESDREYYKDTKCYVMDMETPLHYKIDAKTLSELVAEHVSGQEEMDDEDDNLYGIASTHDYSKLAEELNEKFSKHIYYEPLDIEVILFK